MNPPFRTHPTFPTAHRGLSSEAPENTLHALQAAWDAGFPAVEIDVRRTADRKVVLMHDPGIERTTDGNGRVADMKWKELQTYHTSPTGGVPRLEHALEAANQTGWNGLWNIEIKARNALQPTLQILQEAETGHRALVSSMDDRVIAEAHAHAPDTPRALIIMGPTDEDDLDVARRHECTWVNADHDYIDATTLNMFHDHGIHVGAWTVNIVEEAVALAGMGVESIITDMRAIRHALPESPHPSTW